MCSWIEGRRARLGAVARDWTAVTAGVLAAFAASASAQGRGRPAPVGPVTDVPIHDPVMAREGGRYYVFGTGRGIDAWTSDDLESWRRLDPVFASTPVWVKGMLPDFRDAMWAPDIIEHEGTWYLYYAVSAFAQQLGDRGGDESHARSVRTRIRVGRPRHRRAVGSRPRHVERDRPPVTPPTPTSTTRRSTRGASSMSNRASGNGAIEAPVIFRRDGWYYLFVSWDRCCRGVESTYKVVVGRSRDIRGPYLDREGELMAHGGGSLVTLGFADSER